MNRNLSLILGIFIAFALFSPLVLAADVPDCQSISSSGYYEVNQTISAAGTCIHINADDVILDCKLYSITGPGSSGYGINVTGRNNVTIKNCNVTDFRQGIYFYNTNNSFIENTSSSSNIWNGMIIQSSSNNTLALNTANNNGQDGIKLQSSSNNNTLINNTVKGNLRSGVDLASASSDNNLTSTTAEYNNWHGVLLSSDSINSVLHDTRACSNNQSSSSYYDIYDDDANTYLTREYRHPYVVPDIV